tara:strand:- start:329 stop:883 length:555 start_codon:yes stop_codon:yes gene_type:complete
MMSVNNKLKNLSTFLTQKQIRFLNERPKYTSDKKCAVAVELHPKTVGVWRTRSEQFAEAHDLVRSEIKNGYAEFDKEKFFEERIIPESIKRVAEIVGQPITDGMNAQRMGKIGDTAIKVLGGRGYLKPETEAVFNIGIVAAEAIKENREYVPVWMKQESTEQSEVSQPDQPLDSESSSQSSLSS